MRTSNEHRGQDKITKEDEARIKVMLNNATDPQAQGDREALKRYILNQNFKNNAEIIDAGRKAMMK